MDLDELLNNVKSKAPGDFSPEYLLETEVDATSLIKRCWRVANWQVDEEMTLEEIGKFEWEKPKVKFFSKADAVDVFVIDLGNRYFDFWSI